MSTPSPANKIEVASVSDRGLSEKRPLNEDSFLADATRGIFVVADGVGGADAGEVASQKAVDVLKEAFREKVTDGEDIEDRMELGIQRANSAIHQMAAEHPRFSMMATTVVALHLDGSRATIGHVGDSRLYRLTPDGRLLRETDDHSIVEEEVRAGRMTPEQAANHPSKNVISRALGAEESVEVDMKTMEVEEGTEFLICSDGITRHVSDNEIRQSLISNDDLDAVCKQLKERCYERGAEDNLTVVIIRVGDRVPTEKRLEELEPTLSPEAGSPQPVVSLQPESAFVPASRIAFPVEAGEKVMAPGKLNIAPPKTGRGAARSFSRFLGLLFILALVGG